MDDIVRIPFKLEFDTKDLEELKSEVKKTFEDTHRYESRLGTKAEPFKLKNVETMETLVNSTVDSVEVLLKQAKDLTFDTPVKALAKLRAEANELNQTFLEDKKRVKGAEESIVAAQKQEKEGEEALLAIEEKRAQLNKQYKKDVKAVDPTAKGAKSKLRDLEKQYKLQMEQLDTEQRRAETTRLTGHIEVKDSTEALEKAKEKLSEDQEKLAAVRKERDEMYNISRAHSRTNAYIEERIVKLKAITAEMVRQRDLAIQGAGAVREALEDDQAKTGVSTKSKYEQAIERERSNDMKEVQREADVRERVLREEQKIRRTIAAEEAKEQKRQTAQLIASKNKEISAIKQSAAQYYYKLRAVKMLGFAVNNITNVLTKFGKTSVNVATKALKAYTKLLPGVSLLQKHLSKAATSQKKFATETKKLNGSSKQFNFTLKDLIKNVLKYGIGIRSLFVLFNKLRSAMMFGFENMAKQFDSVNTALSSLLTSFTMMKNAVATAVQPLTNVLAPILEKLSALFADLTYKVASFIAALTGKSTVFKAVRVQQDYAESLDKTAKNAKKAKQELSGLDKLNVINSDKDNGDDSAGNFFEEVPIDSTMADWANKFQDFLNRLIAPIKAAWEKMKSYVLGSWEFMCDKLKSLWGAVAETFWRVWEEEATQKIFENIFRIVGDIMRIVGTLAGKIEEAWRANDNGYRILSSLRDIIGSIVQHVSDATYATLLWAQQLDLVPLFTAIADVLQSQIVPAVDKVLDLLLYLYKEVVLPLAKYVIENILPVLTRAFGNIAEAIGNIAENIQKALEKGDTGKKIVEKVELIAQKVADAFERITGKTKDWSKDLNFENFFTSVDSFLEKIQPALDFVIATVEKFWTDVILPFWSYLVEDGGPKLLDLLGKIFGQYDENTGLGIDWEHLTTVMNEFMDALEPFLELAWETLLQIIEDLGAKFDEFVNSGTLDTIVEKFSEWVENADPDDLADKIEGFAVALGKMYVQFLLISKIILPLVTTFMTFKNFFVQGSMVKNVAKLTEEVAKLSGESTGAGGTGLSGLSTIMGKVGGEAKTLGMVLPDMAKVFQGSSPLAGGLTVITGLFTALSGGFKMMEEGFSFAGEAAVVFGGVLTTIGLILAGIAAWPAVIVGAIVVLIANLGAFGDDLLNWVLTTANDITDKIGEFFHNIGFYIGALIHEALESLFNLLKEGLNYLSKPENWLEFGINILKGILAIFLLPFKLLEWIGSAISNLLAGFIEGLCTGFDMHSPSKAMEPYGENILGGILEGIIGALKTIGTWIKEHIFEPIIEGVKTAFGIVNGVATTFKEIGTNLLEGLKSGITGGWKTIKGAVTDTWDKVTGSAKESYDEHSPSKVFKDIGSYLMQGLEEGLSEEQATTVHKMIQVFKNMLKMFEAELNSNTLVKPGQNLLKGLESGIKQIGNILSAVIKGTNDIKKKFIDGLEAKALINVGKNLINGLNAGLTSALSSALNTVGNLCNQITAKAKQAFQVHSPSRVFEDIGEQLVNGLIVGVDDGADDVGNAFDDLLPSTKMLDSFYDKFMEMITALTSNVTTMFDEMFLHIEESMKNLETIMAMSNLYNSLDKIPDMKLPAIANGQTLPSNKEFKQSSTELDLSKLPDIIKNAVIEAITDTANLQTDDGDTIIEIDGREIFRVVRDENSQYKKQHGASAFA